MVGPAHGTRIVTREGGTTLSLPRLVCTVTRGPDAGRSLTLDALSIRIGKDPGSDLVLSDETVSARHAEIVADAHGLLLRDLGSKNGLLVDGYRAKEIYLPARATLTLGETVVVVEVAEDEASAALSARTNFGALLGHSAAMRAAFAILERAAKVSATVLVSGESGTGKELAARALHDRSPRKDGPYVVFDAGAAAKELVESQLFGHARGAFTGANEAREGVFEAANGGTAVLDEIGELPIELQPKLLRVLETRTITRVGENKPREIDVRFVACTNRNLEEEVRAGRFRQDLFYRLSVITVRLPPLRDRVEEIPRLARHFATAIAGENAKELPEAALRVLAKHDWPGNVRELRNFVERFLVLGDTELAPNERAPADVPDDLPFHEAKASCIDRFERTYFERLLARHRDNVSEAARVAGLSRQSCYRLMQKHGLETD